MGFLPSCGYVSTTEWMHQLDANEKSSKELYKNAMRRFEQILETTLHKTGKSNLYTNNDASVVSQRGP